MTEIKTPMNPDEIREWEMKIARFEGINTEIKQFIVTKGCHSEYFDVTPDNPVESARNQAEKYMKEKNGEFMTYVGPDPGTIPEYHKSLPDLFRVLGKFDPCRINHYCSEWSCEIGRFEIDSPHVFYYQKLEDAVFYGICRHLNKIL